WQGDAETTEVPTGRQRNAPVAATPRTDAPLGLGEGRWQGARGSHPWLLTVAPLGLGQLQGFDPWLPEGLVTCRTTRQGSGPARFAAVDFFRALRDRPPCAGWGLPFGRASGQDFTKKPGRRPPR